MVQKKHGQKNSSHRPSQSPTRSPVEEMQDELVALTGKEQLKVYVDFAALNNTLFFLLRVTMLSIPRHECGLT